MIIYSPHVIQDIHVILIFFSRKEIKVFDENITGFFSMQWTSMGTKRFKVQKTVSVQTVQRALNDSDDE